jgi:hypothetical protein
MRRLLPALIAIATTAPAGCYLSHVRLADDAGSEDALIDSVDFDAEIDVPVDLIDEDLAGCHDRTFDVSTGHPDVIVLMDRSYSMEDDFWGPASDAVNDILDQWEHQVAFGLAVFPSSLCTYGSFQCVPTNWVEVHPELDNAADVRDALVAQCCCGGTPLAPSLDFVGRYFEDLDDGRSHHVLLVTDGAPNCNPDLDAGSCVCTATDACVGEVLNCLDDVRTVSSAAALYDAGVPVHVLGLSEAAIRWSWVMDDIAEAGGTTEAVLAEQPEAIAAAMESIAGDVAPCRFELLPGEVVDPDDTTFLVDGVEVPHDPTHTDGWDWFNAWTVDFHGPACDRIVAGDVETVTARINCES